MKLDLDSNNNQKKVITAAGKPSVQVKWQRVFDLWCDWTVDGQTFSTRIPKLNGEYFQKFWTGCLRIRWRLWFYRLTKLAHISSVIRWPENIICFNLLIHPNLIQLRDFGSSLKNPQNELFLLYNIYVSAFKKYSDSPLWDISVSSYNFKFTL